jgi:hypothetical protein
MNLRPLLTAGLLAGLAATAAPAIAALPAADDTVAAAAAVLFSDDAEAGPEAKWTVTAPANTAISPFQRSDSGTLKVRGNQRSQGTRSFWTGVAVDKLQPVDVQSGISAITTKAPIAVPDGGATLTYASLFQNEGDDVGAVEVASAAAPSKWTRVDEIVAVNTAAGTTDEAVCNPADPDALQRGLAAREADLSKFAGQEVLVRFVLEYGGENRALSQPCGWYVDDVKVAAK